MARREKMAELLVEPQMAGQRLDVCLSANIQGLSRSIFSDEQTTILLNGKPVKKSRIVKAGEHIRVSYVEECFTGIVAQDIPLSVLYEDQDLLVINKEQGMVVHPAAGNYENTLVNALLFRYGQDFSCSSEDDEESEPNEVDLRPGIVHRLDKDTSGVLVIAKNAQSHRHLSAQFKDRTTKKVYIALAKGRFKEQSASIRSNIKRDSVDRKKFTTCSEDEGRDAHTDYVVLKQYPDFALLRITLHTGRTHQIRVHLKSIGHPIIGDPLYGKPDGQTLMLHAMLLEVDSPSMDTRIRCIAPMPERFRSMLRTALRLSSSRVRSGSLPTATGRD